MAKNWDFKEETGTLVRNYNLKEIMEESGKVEIILMDKLEFSLIALFEDFLTLDEVQKSCIINGIKQKMDDSVARSKEEKLTLEEMKEIHEKLWERITIERKWNMEKEGGKRAGSVSLKLVLPILLKAGMSIEDIAKECKKNVEEIIKMKEEMEEREKEI